MRRALLIGLVCVVAASGAIAQPDFDAEQESARFLAEAVDNGRAAIENISLYAELVVDRDPDDQEIRISILTLAVASASRATTFFEVYDRMIEQAGAQPPSRVASAIAALGEALLLVPEAAGAALTAETAGEVHAAEIQQSALELEQRLAPHLDALASLETAASVSTGSLVGELAEWRQDLQRRIEGDADELALLFARITNSGARDETESVELAYQAGTLQSMVAALDAVEETLGQRAAGREHELDELRGVLRELGTDVAEDLAEVASNARVELILEHSEDIAQIIAMLHRGAWRTDQ